MPPLEDDLVPNSATALVHDDGLEGEEIPATVEAELNLAAQVDAMQMNSGQGMQPDAELRSKDASQPIIQFPEEDGQGSDKVHSHQFNIEMTADMLANMQRFQHVHRAASGSSYRERGPRPSDMIPALRDLSNLQVSFGSVSDVSMLPADTVLGKRGAEEQEVQGKRLELSLGLDYGGGHEDDTQRRGKMQKSEQKRTMEVVYTRAKKQTATGHSPTGNLTRPNVWSRQEQ